MRPSLRRPAAGIATLALTVGFAACGSSSDDSSSSSSTATPAATSGGTTIAVPDSVKSKGTLTIAADASYAPNEFIKPGNNEVVGMDADLGKAIGAKLGLTVKIQNATFDAIIPGIASGKYDLGMSSFTDTKEREKTVDFVTYFSAGTSFYVKASGGPAINTIADLCNHKVAVESGTTQADDAKAQSKKCKVTVLVYPDQTAANLALNSGRADVGMADSPVAAYAVKQSAGTFKLVGQEYGTAPYGIAIKKGSDLVKPVEDAVTSLIADGTYKKILDTWGVENGAVEAPAVNGATS
ncbi:MAG: ABC transporter substrate-binding protein [Solirubrobacteraceae bacterium]|nr:ABC transporter substrate-binding protein [Patulibacter sp.]